MSSRKPRHTTDTSGRGSAQRSGGMWQGRPGRDAEGFVCPVNKVLAALWGIENIVLNDFSEARTKDIQFKPMVEQKPLLTTGLSVGRRPLLVSGCWPVYRRMFFCIPFSCQACRGIAFFHWTCICCESNHTQLSARSEFIESICAT